MPQTNRLLIQVVAQLKPERCGVSDHAIRLAQELESAFQIRTAFVVLNSTEPCAVSFPRVYCAPSQLLETCISLGEGQPGSLLLHYSGYGYSRDGAPLGLADALERVRESEQFRIATYFHELYAVGMPWKSAFWYTRRQKQIIRRLARSSDLILTNLTYHLDWLQREAIHEGVPAARLLPTLSNVGECAKPPLFSGRRPALVVFGLADTRQKAYEKLSTLGGLIHTLGIEEIVDVGPSFDAPSELNGTPVRRMGVLPAEELSRTISEAMFGFVKHEPFCMAKSGVLAGLCALGAIPVVAEPFAEEFDGIQDGVQVVSFATAAAAMAGGLEKCSAAAWRWYTEHSVHVHAAEYAKWMELYAFESDSNLHSESLAAGV
jgi:hypothetical protein